MVFSCFARRQREEDGGSMVDLAFGPDSAPVAADDALHRGEAYPCAREVVVAVKTLKRSEQLGDVAHVEARAVVAHEEHALAVLLERAELDARLWSLLRELPGVAEQVV